MKCVLCAYSVFSIDIFFPDVASKRKCLKSNAVPSRNLPHSRNTAAREARRERVVKRNRKKGRREAHRSRSIRIKIT